jgi:hypothetical protein
VDHAISHAVLLAHAAKDQAANVVVKINHAQQQPATCAKRFLRLKGSEIILLPFFSSAIM